MSDNACISFIKKKKGSLKTDNNVSIPYCSAKTMLFVYHVFTISNALSLTVSTFLTQWRACKVTSTDKYVHGEEILSAQQQI